MDIGKFYTMRNVKKNIISDDGFTLVELLVVLAIIGLLVGIGTPRVLNYLASAKVDTAKTQIRNFESALELYYIDNGNYPTTEQGLNALVSKPNDNLNWNGPYLKIKGQILDPWGQEYLYKTESANVIAITSLGSDRTQGGEGTAADITN